MHIAEIGHDVLSRLSSFLFDMTNLVSYLINHLVFQIVYIILQERKKRGKNFGDCYGGSAVSVVLRSIHVRDQD